MQRYLPAEEARVFNEDIKHLEGIHNLTYLMDGWEDGQRHSVYGSLMTCRLWMQLRATTQAAAGDTWDPASLLHSLGV